MLSRKGKNIFDANFKPEFVKCLDLKTGREPNLLTCEAFPDQGICLSYLGSGDASTVSDAIAEQFDSYQISDF
ncbi:unnamed protein product [Dovyalis caffra]|uniref:Uncharacterized protein n=1 Tax=Dovyalis caffra TaxID=77055 RepID=A0AAV1QZ81_9ROSI|nr:unnamed protein product [Dovyalis caffra]